MCYLRLATQWGMLRCVFSQRTAGASSEFCTQLLHLVRTHSCQLCLPILRNASVSLVSASCAAVPRVAEKPLPRTASCMSRMFGSSEVTTERLDRSNADSDVSYCVAFRWGPARVLVATGVLAKMSSNPCCVPAIPTFRAQTLTKPAVRAGLSYLLLQPSSFVCQRACVLRWCAMHRCCSTCAANRAVRWLAQAPR